MLRQTIATMTVLLALAMPAWADRNAASGPAVKSIPAPRADHGFAVTMAHHHQEGIRMANRVIASGSRAEVKELARRIKSGQEKDLAILERHQGDHGATASMPEDPDMKRGMEQLAKAKGPAADSLFLDLMIAHHASGLLMSHVAAPRMKAPELRRIAREGVGKQAREIGELQKLREQTSGGK